MNPFPDDTTASCLLNQIRAEIPTLPLTRGDKGCGPWVAELAGISDEELLGKTVRDAEMAAAVRSGLLLRGDHLDESHTVSQGLPSATGSYWHGIMHRREPDYGNSKYWFRRVGDHPVFPELATEAGATANRDHLQEILRAGQWDPFHFIDLCEACTRGPEPEIGADLLAVQELEINLLLRYSYRRAAGELGA